MKGEKRRRGRRRERGEGGGKKREEIGEGERDEDGRRRGKRGGGEKEKFQVDSLDWQGLHEKSYFSEAWVILCVGGAGMWGESATNTLRTVQELGVCGCRAF